MHPAINHWEAESALAIVDMTGKVFDCWGHRLGRSIASSGVAFSISHDCQTLVWPVPKDRAVASSRGNEIRIVGRNGDRTVAVAEGWVRMAAASSFKRFCGLVSWGKRDVSLLLFDESTKLDLTPIVERHQLDRIETLRFSASGKLLAVGSRVGFIVINIRLSSVVFESLGRFPAFGAVDETVAFVSALGRLALVNLAGAHVSYPVGDLRVSGVGGWSPDGRCLLVGIPTFLSNQLTIVDFKESHKIDVLKMDEGVFGNRCLWIDRRFVSP